MEFAEAMTLVLAMLDFALRQGYRVVGVLEEGRAVMLEEARRVPNGVVTFDTQRVVDRLREGGWDEGQARALCDVLREIMRGVAMSSELERVEASLRGEIKSVEASLEGRMVALEGQMASLRLVMLAGFGFLGVLVALGNFL